MNAIEIGGLRHAFGAVNVLQGVDLAIPGPGLFGFLGVNGSGKTTTLRALAGLLRPDAGEIRLLGLPLGDPLLAGKVGYLPQAPDFYPWMSAAELLEFLADLAGVLPGKRAGHVAELLAGAGLEAVARRRVGGFSGGMKQRLGLAAALVGDPPLLLLDEPVSALDPVGRREALEILAELGARHTVLFSSHILADVARICQQVAVLHQGRILRVGAPDALVGDAARPVLALRVVGAPPAWEAALRALPGVALVTRKSTPQGEEIWVEAADLARAQREIPAAVAAAGLGLAELRPVVPDLESAFLKMIGEVA